MDNYSVRVLEACIKHFKDDPVGFAEEVIGIELSEQQKKVARGLVEHRKVVVRSGHGCGKSCLQSVMILWFMATRPYCKIACTAPSAHQLQDILWAEVSKWYDVSLLKEVEMFTINRDIMRLNSKDHGKNWFAVPISVTNPEALSGIHAKSVMYVLDESAGIDESIIERIEGALTTEDCYFLSMGNPSFTHGTLYNLCTKYSNHYKVYTLSAEESPLVEKKWIEFMEDKYGRDSDVFRVRVLGEFPTASANAIMSPDAIRDTLYRDVQGEDDFDAYHVGIDVASYGDDKTVICIRKGNEMIGLKEYNGRSLVDIARIVKHECSQLNRSVTNIKELKNIFIKIDTTGLGIGLSDILNDELEHVEYVKIIDINFSNRAYDEEQYSDVVTEMLFELRDKINKLSFIQVENRGEDSEQDLIEELSGRMYEFDSKNRFKVESKKKMKERLGRSPDLADAIMLAFYDSFNNGEIHEDYFDYGNYSNDNKKWKM